ncbi:MAG: hypothetical protein AAGC85_11230 [Bacteroidota bacterium]
MKYLPYDQITIHSPLSISQINQKLRKHLSDRPWWKMGGVAPNTYRGNLYSQHFNISRIINYRNSFLPQIRGEMSSTPYGSLVKLTFRLPLIASCFMMLWMGGVSFALIVIMIGLFTDPSVDFNLFMLAPVAMLLFGYLLTLLGFKAESNPSIAFFQELLEHQKEFVDNNTGLT